MYQKIIFLGLMIFSHIVLAANPREYIIDTDMAIDDAIAILYLTQARPVKAITISGAGEAHCESALKNVAGLLALVNKTIPYACGRSQPLNGNHHFTADIRALADTLFHTNNLLNSTKSSPTTTAKNLLAHTLKQAAQPITILAIGPLTNIADVIQSHPELIKKINKIYLMGGAVHVRGDLPLGDAKQKNITAEWNMYIDPKAANIVFRSGVAITLIPLDVTNQFPIDNQFYQQLKKHHQTPATNYLFELFSRNEKELVNNDWYFWDPLAAVIAADDSIAKTKIEKLRIVQTPEIISGTTIIDEQHGNSVAVCVSATKEEFIKRLLSM